MECEDPGSHTFLSLAELAKHRERGGRESRLDLKAHTHTSLKTRLSLLPAAVKSPLPHSLYSPAVPCPTHTAPHADNTVRKRHPYTPCPFPFPHQEETFHGVWRLSLLAFCCCDKHQDQKQLGGGGGGEGCLGLHFHTTVSPSRQTGRSLLACNLVPAAEEWLCPQFTGPPQMCPHADLTEAILQLRVPLPWRL